MNRKPAIIILIFLVIITGLFASQLPKLSFNYIFEDFFPVDDPDLIAYNKFVERFENDNDYLLLGVTDPNGIFNQSFLKKIERITNALKVLPATKLVTSITTLEQAIISPAGVFNIPLVHIDEPDRLVKDSIRIYKQPHLVASIVSKDGTATLLAIKHHPLIDKEDADNFVAQIVNILEAANFNSYVMAGKIYAQGVFIDKIQEELTLFLSASIVLVFVFLAIAYRSWWGILIPLTIVGMATVWILGLMAWLGKQLDLLMVLLPTIMFVVGMSDVVHLMTKYIENLRRGDAKPLAIKVAVKEVGLATFLTSLTTAVGFLTLMTASIRPIQGFGVYTAIGVFIAFIVAFLFLPASWVLLKTPAIAHHKEHRNTWFSLLGSCLIYVAKHRWRVLLIALVTVVVSSFGISLIVINTYLIEDLPENDPLKVSFVFFDERFGGSRPFEAMVAVKKKDQTIFHPEVVREVEKVNVYLASTHDVGGLVSTNTPVKAINQAVNGGSVEAYQLPENKEAWQKINRPLKRMLIKEELQGELYTPDKKYGRISGWIDDIGSKTSLAKNNDFEEFINKHVDDSVVEVTLTGTSNLIDKNNLYLAQNMMQGLGIAFGVVALIAGFLFRSARMVLITLIPNIIPLMMVAGIMGFFDITLKLSTSIVFTIAFGIAVDDTIHFTSKLKLELDKGKSLLYALKRTYLSTGKAIIVTSIILSGGFLILILSSFGGTFYTGLLISLTLIFALIIDLTLLPAFILLFFKRRGKLTSSNQ